MHTTSRKGAWHMDRNHLHLFATTLTCYVLEDGVQLQELRLHGTEETMLLPEREGNIYKILEHEQRMKSGAFYSWNTMRCNLHKYNNK